MSQTSLKVQAKLKKTHLKISKMQEQKALFFNFFIDFSSLNGIHYFGRIHPPPGLKT
jgi:hypothetical protein